MKKCSGCFHYDFEGCYIKGKEIPSGWCNNQRRPRPRGYGCSKWRSKKSWFMILAQYLTDFWYDYIRLLFRK